QVRRPRLRPRHDEAVEPTVPQLPQPRIAALHMASARIRPRHLRQPVERQPHHQALRRRLEQRHKLPLRRLQRRVRHVVDQADLQTVRVRLTELHRRRPPQAPGPPPPPPGPQPSAANGHGPPDILRPAGDRACPETPHSSPTPPADPPAETPPPAGCSPRAAPPAARPSRSPAVTETRSAAPAPPPSSAGTRSGSARCTPPP